VADGLDERIVHGVPRELDVADDRDRDAQEHGVPLAIGVLDLREDGVGPRAGVHAYMIPPGRRFL
jgi:hypothetical protein